MDVGFCCFETLFGQGFPSLEQGVECVLCGFELDFLCVKVLNLLLNILAGWVSVQRDEFLRKYSSSGRILLTRLVDRFGLEHGT